MHRIAKNLYNSLFAIDLSKKDNLGYLLEIFVFVEKGIPIRFGIAPVVDIEKKTEISKLFFFNRYFIKYHSNINY